MRVLRTLLVASVGAVAAAGCGGPDMLPGHGSRASAFERSVRVIEAWSTALRSGDVRAAARYFQVPSVFVNGPNEVLVLRSRAAVQVANRLLPCGAVYVSASRDGRYVNALFRLTDRPGPGGGPNGCGVGVGTTARVDFVIQDGKITHWLRAASEPGDRARAHLVPQRHGGTATAPGTNTVPATPPPSATVQTPTTPTTPAPPTGTATAAGPKV
jgi:hypothetical protein